MKNFLVRIARAVFSAVEALFDLLYGLLLRAVRGLHLLLASRAARAAGRATLRGARIAAMTAVFVGAGLGLGWACFERVPAGFTGVRQTNFGGVGLSDTDAPAGLAFCVAGLHTLHLVESTTQVLAFAWESEGGEHAALDVRTRDGNMANVSVALPYRVVPGAAHLLVGAGLKLAYKQRVRATAEKVLLEDLGALSSEDLMSTERRLEHAGRTLTRLNQLLAEYHVRAEAVLVTQVLFRGEFEKKLQQKQLTAQEAMLHKAATEVEEAKKKVDLIQTEIDSSVKNLLAEWDKQIEERYAAGKRRIAGIQAETRYYDKTRRGEADTEVVRLAGEGERAIAQAESLKEELANKTYDTTGGRLMLARTAAENLNIKQVTLNSNDPRVPSVLDIDELVKRLVGKQEP